LEKRIPMAAGLGGGSSDAASALLALRRLWRAPVDDGAIRVIASSLGADVAYFFVGGTALGLGRGDEIYPLAQLPEYWVVLGVPSFGVATRDAYRWLDDDRRKGLLEPLPTRQGRVLSQFPGITFSNDLEAPVVARHPVIGDLVRCLDQRGALLAAMSGSGSTVFGVFDSAGRAAIAARAVGETGVRAIRSRFLRRKVSEACP
jgi:4-diphosphocytidyl-2-C-methyl-D-erythritol kinase